MKWLKRIRTFVRIVFGLALVAFLVFAARQGIHQYLLSQYPPGSLHVAVVEGDVDTVREMLRLGANPNEPNVQGDRPLHLIPWRFMEHEHEEVLRLLLAHGADVDAINAKGHTPLLLVMQHSVPENGLRILVEGGVNPNFLLRQLSYRHQEEKLRILVEAGAKVRAREALYLGDAERLALLLEDDPDAANRTRVDGQPVLMTAVELGRADMVRVVLDAGTDPNLREGAHGPALYLATVQSENSDVFELLLSRGADPNIPNFWGSTPLHWAVRNRDAAKVKALLKHGADPNIADKDGTEPLHGAVKQAWIEGVSMLLAGGADPERPQGGKGSALRYAQQRADEPLLPSDSFVEAVELMDAAVKESRENKE